MNRFGNLYSKIVSLENIISAEKKARKGKNRYKDIIKFMKDYKQNILEVQRELVNKTFTTSEYSVFTIYEPKERIIYKLPYKDRIVQHSIMNIIEEILLNSFTKDTYSCIKERGIHLCLSNLVNAISYS